MFNKRGLESTSVCVLHFWSVLATFFFFKSKTSTVSIECFFNKWTLIAVKRSMSQEDRDPRCLFCKLTYKLQALNTNHEPVRAVLFEGIFEGRKLVLHFLRYMIGLKNSRHFFIQSEVKPKPIVKRSHAFSRKPQTRIKLAGKLVIIKFYLIAIYGDVTTVSLILTSCIGSKMYSKA